MCLLDTSELGFGRIPYFERVDIGADHIFEVRCHSTAVDLGPRAGAADALSHVEDDAREAARVDPYFLVVRDLAQLAGAALISLFGV